MRPRWFIACVIAVFTCLATPRDTLAQAWQDLNFVVRDATTHAPIGGAHVQIDVDFGNGTVRYTDGGGFTNFGVIEGNLLNYYVQAGGFSGAGGQVWIGGPNTIEVFLGRTSPPPAVNGRGEPITLTTGDGTLIITPLETDSNATTIEMHMHFKAANGRFEAATCVRLWSDHPEWEPQETGCWYNTSAFSWEDDYEYYWPRWTGTVASAYQRYLQGREVQPPAPGDNPLGRLWEGVSCADSSAIRRRFYELERRAIREAFRDMALAAYPCVGVGIGWASCMNIAFVSSILTRVAVDHWNYKEACAY